MRLLTSLAAAAAAIAIGCSYPPMQPLRMPEAKTAAPAGVEHTEGTFEGVRGTRLYEQSWQPTGQSLQPTGGARATVIVVHGLKDHSANYRALAERLAQQGLAVHAFDLRGHGRSEGVRVWVDEFDDYLGDLDLFVKRAHAGGPVLLFGHSMGGAITTLYTIAHPAEVRGLALSGAALATDVPGAVVGGTKLVAALSPMAGVFNLDLHQFSRDPAVVSAGLADPFVYQQGAPARTALELLGVIDRIQAHMEDVTVPLLAMHGGADVITPPSGSKALVERARSTDKTLKVYPGLYHDLLHEPEKEQVMADLVKWLSDHAPVPAVASPAPPPVAHPPAALPAPAPPGTKP